MGTGLGLGLGLVMGMGTEFGLELVCLLPCLLLLFFSSALLPFISCRVSVTLLLSLVACFLPLVLSFSHEHI